MKSKEKEKEKEFAKELINKFDTDALELTKIRIGEIELELKYWKKVKEELEKL